jgi:plastocyanin
MRKPTLMVLGAAAAALAMAGCGGGSSGSSSTATGAKAPTTTPSPSTSGGAAPSGAGQTLSLSADPSGQLAFDKKTLTAKAGGVTLKMANPSQLPHGIAVEGNGVDKDGKVVQHGGTSLVSVKLKPGKYEFYCPVPGHKQAGMKGTLTVQ